MMNLTKNDRKMQKILQKIWSCQKKVVILQAFSRERMREGVETILLIAALGSAERLNRCLSAQSKTNKINGIQFLQDSVCQQRDR